MKKEPRKLTKNETKQLLMNPFGKPVKEPKCKLCWDKGFSTELVGGIHGSFERKNYCTCKKGQKLAANPQITKCPKCSSRKYVISIFGSICPDCFYEEKRNLKGHPPLKKTNRNKI
jgi:NAD-dependent SIR2 family protein deacetylase